VLNTVTCQMNFVWPSKWISTITNPQSLSLCYFLCCFTFLSFCLFVYFVLCTSLFLCLLFIYFFFVFESFYNSVFIYSCHSVFVSFKQEAESGHVSLQGYVELLQPAFRYSLSNYGSPASCSSYFKMQRSQVATGGVTKHRVFQK
jgi:hypothetical protein